MNREIRLGTLTLVFAGIGEQAVAQGVAVAQPASPPSSPTTSGGAPPPILWFVGGLIVGFVVGYYVGKTSGSKEAANK